MASASLAIRRGAATHSRHSMGHCGVEGECGGKHGDRSKGAQYPQA